MHSSNFAYSNTSGIVTDEVIADIGDDVLIEHCQGDCINLISGDNKRAIASLINDEGVYKIVVFSEVDSEEYTHLIDVTEAVTGNK